MVHELLQEPHCLVMTSQRLPISCCCLLHLRWHRQGRRRYLALLCGDQIEAVGLLKQLMNHKVNQASVTTDTPTLKGLLNKLTLYANKPDTPILSVGGSTRRLLSSQRAP
ncbi:hypothetical protein QOT17_007616 [Balamuthia mandrillaris]